MEDKAIIYMMECQFKKPLYFLQKKFSDQHNNTMITCKICEKDVLDERLGLHSQKCREVAEYREFLMNIISTMEAHGDKALSMKNSLETHAARQQKRQNKKPSFKEILEIPYLDRTRSSSSWSQNGASPRSTLRTNDTEYLNSEEGREKADQISSTREASEPSEEPIGRMSEEEYSKFVEEVKKCMIVLKKVIQYTKNIANWALELSCICEVSRITQSELEADEKEIRDENVLKFLRTFREDLESYIVTRRKYLDALHELARINSPKTHFSHRHRIVPKRSTSSHPTPDINATKTPMTIKRKENSNPLTFEGIESPIIEKRKLPSSRITPMDVGVGSPALMRKLPIKQMIQEPVSTKSSVALKGFKFDLSKPLLQTNNNHQIAGLNKFAAMAGTKKNIEDNTVLREKIKTTLSKKNLDKHNCIMDIEPMSPNVLTQSKSTEQKVKKVRERLAMMNCDVPLSTFSKAKNEEKVISEQPVVPTMLGSPRGNSVIALFNTLRNEDILGIKKFPQSTNKNSSNPSNSSSSTWSSNSVSMHEGVSPKLANETNVPGNSTPKSKPKKIEESSEFFESLKGYYSDCNTSRLRRRVSKQDSTDPTFDDFEIMKFIGKGAYGNVWLVKKKTTGDYYAMKTVDWADKNTHERIKALKAEKDIYQALKGDFFVKAFWTFEYENLICFVTEYMPGGDFSKILDEFSRLDEEYAQFYFAELVQALESLHNLGVVHRDLKPENMLIDAKGHVRLTDFGLSQQGIEIFKDKNVNMKNSQSPTGQDDPIIKARMNSLRKFCKSAVTEQPKSQLDLKEQAKSTGKKTEKIFSFLGKDEETIAKKSLLKKVSKESITHDKKPRMVGTPDYMAPEIIAPEKYEQEKYDEKCMDWWSMGAILYQILVGVPPFCDETIQRVFDNIREYRIEWPSIGDGEDCISEVAADLIKKLLNPDPKKRLGANGAAEVRKHPFFKGIDWAKLREREAPIIPCPVEEELKKDETVTPQLKNGDAPKTAVNMQSNPIKRSKTSANNIDFGAFKMRRIDLLDQANQIAHQDIVSKRKKSQN